MGNPVVLFASIGAVALLIGLLLGLLIGSSHAHSKALIQLDIERKLADSRELPLREQLESAFSDMVELRIKAAERERFKAQTEERDAAIMSLRSDKAELESRLDAVTGEREMTGRLLAIAEQRLRSEEAKYTQMKADLDSAFKGVAADALRANTQSFLTLAREQLGRTNQRSQTDPGSQGTGDQESARPAGSRAQGPR